MRKSVLPSLVYISWPMVHLSTSEVLNEGIVMNWNPREPSTLELSPSVLSSDPFWYNNSHIPNKRLILRQKILVSLSLFFQLLIRGSDRIKSEIFIGWREDFMSWVYGVSKGSFPYYLRIKFISVPLYTAKLSSPGMGTPPREGERLKPPISKK